MTELVLESVPVDQIVPNPWNPNRQNDAVRKALSESIEEFGFIDPVTVRQMEDGTYQVINGEHRWREAVEQGHTEVGCVVIEANDDQARRLTLILNETVGEGDVVAIGTLLSQLRQDDVDMETLLRGLPYSTTEVAHLLSLADAEWDAFDPSPPESPPDPDARTEVVTMTLTFTRTQHTRFERMLRRAAAQLDIEDNQEVVKTLVKRGYDTL